MRYNLILILCLNTAAVTAQDIAGVYTKQENNYGLPALTSMHQSETFLGHLNNGVFASHLNYSADNLFQESEKDTVKHKGLRKVFKFDMAALLSGMIMFSGEFLLKNRLSIEPRIGGIFQFRQKEVKKGGFALMTGMKWYPLKNYNPDKPLDGFYMKGELGYTRMNFRWIVDYRFNLFGSIPVYSRESYVINNYAIHFFGGYHTSLSRKMTMDLCAGLGTSVQTRNYDNISVDPEIPGIYSLVGKNALSASFNVSIGTAF